MLGGPVYIAFIRLIFNLAGTILIFSLLSESRFSRKKTIICYGCYGMVLAVLACVWYVADWESYARMVAFVVGGLEISIIFFERNVWADIIARILLIALITFLLNTYVKESIKGFSDYVGMEAAKELRDMGNRANLIFLTTSREYALEAFDVDASQYLLKPVTEKRLSDALDRFMESAEAEQKNISCLE